MRTEFDYAVTDSATETRDNSLFRKIGWRILPLLWVCYLLNYLDKTNISFAQLQMKEALGFSDAVFGFAGGLLFAGLIAFEIPSNIILPRIGFRTTLLRIMSLWGLATAAISLVSEPILLYFLRFLVGAFEAGFAPGVLYFISLYYPEQRRAQAIAIFYTAASAARIISGPLAALIMTGCDGFAGLRGWQWLFILQGLPCVLVAIIAHRYLTDTPEKSDWLTKSELARHQDVMNADGPISHDFQWRHFVELIKDIRIWAGGLIGFFILVALFGLTFWQPVLLKGLGLSLTEIGLLTVVPSTCGIISSILIARSSDALGERCWHFVLAALLGAVGFMVITFFPTNRLIVILSLSVAAIGMSGGYALTWVIVAKELIGKHSATGYAILTVIQGAAGVVGPIAVAALKTDNGDFTWSLYLMAATSVMSALVCIWFYYSEPVRAPTPWPAEVPATVE